MSAQAADRWQDLFARALDGRAVSRLSLRVVRRGGQPFLWLPLAGPLAARALALYPAQSAKARLARKLLELALRLGISPLREREELNVAANEPFAKFLAECAGLSELPPLAILAGNPHAPGRRFVVLVFNVRGQSAAVIKTGRTEAARQLVMREADLLAAVPAGTPGVPRLKAAFQAHGVQAFALNFIAGNSPQLDDTQPLAGLFTAWLVKHRRVSLCDLESWRLLRAASASAPLPAALDRAGDLNLHPTLAHGDFAPWNIKVADGQWTVLDWERGQQEGIPGWDWVHFVVQSAILVRHEHTAALLARLERTLASPEFSNYARHAGFGGHERLLALAYLAFAARVTRQTEGLAEIKSLEQAAAAHWFSTGC